jgi:hypothetical protein
MERGKDSKTALTEETDNYYLGYENNSYLKQEADRTHKFTSKDKVAVPMQRQPPYRLR